MKKILNFVITIAALLLLISLLVFSLNDILGFLDTSKFQGLVDYLINYGALTIVGALVFVNIIGKGIIRIILLFLFIAILAFYIFANSFPADFIKLFGI